jgi:hypothetical protein
MLEMAKAIQTTTTKVGFVTKVKQYIPKIMNGGSKGKTIEYNAVDKASKKIVRNLIRRVHGNNSMVTSEFKRYRNMNTKKRKKYVEDMQNKLKLS